MKIQSLDKDMIKRIKRFLPILLILPALTYLPGILGKIPFPSDSAPYTDLLITHYPYALVLKQSLLDQGVLPLWSPLIYSGMPFAANPLAGIFYLPDWLALFFPLPGGISLVMALHAVFGSIGFYLWLREEGISELPALSGSLAFGLMPKAAAHYGAGHVTLIYALSWTPWLFLFRRKDSSGWLCGAAAGLLFLADPRWVVYAGPLWLSYNISHRHFQTWKEEIIFHAKAALTAFLVASPLLLPLLEFNSLSTRSNLALKDMLANSLPPGQLLGLIIPSNGGNVEWAIYSGGVLLSLFLIQFSIKDLRKRNLFWTIWIGISLFISLGIWFSGAEWLTHIPVISWVRVPARAIFVTGFSLAVIAATTLERLTEGPVDKVSVQKTAAAMIAFGVLMVGGLVYLVEDRDQTLFWGFITLGLASLVLVIVVQKAGYRKYSWLLAVIMIVELLAAGKNFLVMKAESEIENLHKYLEEFLSSDKDLFRIYSPSYSVPQELAAEMGLELADGVDPLQLQTYQDFMEISTGVDISGYSISIPPFASGHPEFDNRGNSPDLEYLGLLNVKYIVSEFEIRNKLLVPQESECDCFIYLNNAFLPRAWVIPEESDMPLNYSTGRDVKSIKIEKRKPNSVTVLAEGPGKLVLSEIFYPGWTATIDEEPTKIIPAYDILRSVTLPEGEHTVVFSFHPIKVYAGILLAAGGWLNILLILIRKRV